MWELRKEDKSILVYYDNLYLDYFCSVPVCVCKKNLENDQVYLGMYYLPKEIRMQIKLLLRA